MQVLISKILHSIKRAVGLKKNETYNRVKIHYIACVFLIIASVMLFLVSVFDGVGLTSLLYDNVGIILSDSSMKIYPMLRCLKLLLRLIKDYCSLAVTYTTMLMAVVIFFYSIKDNRRLGIPVRTIMAYSVGSFTIPTMFVVLFILIPLLYVYMMLNWTLSFYVCLAYVFIIQIVIVLLIFLASSFQFALDTICKAERVQYNSMISKTVCKEIDLERHLVTAIASTDVDIDKIFLLRKILLIPFEELNEKTSQKQDDVSFKKRYECIYNYYFENVRLAAEAIEEKGIVFSKSRMYEVLYEFIKERAGVLSNRIVMEPKEDLKKYYNEYNKELAYFVAVSGIMNGIIESKVENADVFCVNVLNECVPNDNTSIILYNLYLMFFHFQSTYNQYRETKYIAYIKKGETGEEERVPNYLFYGFFWDVWMSSNRYSKAIGAMQFLRAMDILVLKKNWKHGVRWNYRMIHCNEYKDNTKEDANENNKDKNS